MAAGVAMGAFGAHALKTRLTPGDMEIYQKAVLYQITHALGIGMVALIGLTKAELAQSSLLAGSVLLAGVAIFSGSLYLLVLTDTRWLGAITPIGGSLLIAGWLILSFALLKTTP